ncbi:Glycosyltransferase 25 family member [Aphelenchoides fujianensis]|nr:Glycosyltransferase 25 family member [Aphelenchoides fujianensis]
MGVPLFIDNHHFYGHFLDSRSKTTSEHKALLSSLLNQLQDGGPGVALHSAALPPWTPQPTTFGFDRVLVVNLERRPERMQRMERVMRTLGIEFTRFDATDGRLLTERELAPIHELPGYLDPFHKRPLKRGEIGCFLSHYRIWTEIVDEELDRALVFEDDIRFTENATRILRGLIEDLTKERTDWDLIYLGRKKNDPQAKEFFVPGHRYLSTVTYSYWTLGYAISRQGAQKLLDARPLDRLVALDEFLPIMYDQHPNREWKAHFGRRDLRAFAAYPVIVTSDEVHARAGLRDRTRRAATSSATPPARPPNRPPTSTRR